MKQFDKSGRRFYRWMPALLLFLIATPIYAQSLTPYAVVINHEEQYSIWPADREVPRGWKMVEDKSAKGTVEACMAYIEEVWTDMRPLSLRTMMKEKKMQRDDASYRVVINHEEQYSIWLADLALPEGWKDTGEAGSYRDCRAYIEEVWTDMRPLSLRKKMGN